MTGGDLGRNRRGCVALLAAGFLLNLGLLAAIGLGVARFSGINGRPALALPTFSPRGLHRGLFTLGCGERHRVRPILTIRRPRSLGSVLRTNAAAQRPWGTQNAN